MQITDNEEIYYSMALTRLSGVNHAVALQLYKELGDAQAVYEATKARLPWDEALHRAAAEMEFVTEKNIRVLTIKDADYPRRLSECADAPILLYYKGTANLNPPQVINIVGTRQCTPYGQDLIRHFVSELRQLCPDVLIVSGLAYGVDICAHRSALENGFDTIRVVAHGLDQIYPYQHRNTAAEMTRHGGLLTEYMSQTQALPNNFRQRNRIVAGMSDHLSHCPGIRARRVCLPGGCGDALLRGLQQDDSRQYGWAHHVGKGLHGVDGMEGKTLSRFPC